MKVFMLGWEFPPYISGGLGTACYGLTQAMSSQGMKITFVLPGGDALHFGEGQMPEMAELNNVKFRPVSAHLSPYVQVPSEGSAHRNKHSSISARPGKGGPERQARSEDRAETENYGRDLFTEVRRFTDKAVDTACEESFDIIHAHDWMTFPAAAGVAGAARKPFVVQVHSTEFDRSGENVNQAVYDIERAGMHAANKVIAVSNYTRNIAVERYGVPADRIEVVYNGVSDRGYRRPADGPSRPDKREKIVLYLGRITRQKGPEFFLRAARRVLEVTDDVKFIMAGGGDLLYPSVEMTAEMGMGTRVLFTRFLRGADVDRAYRMADLYVMPSVSEPFGIAPLEALQNDVPVLISRQSGLAEALANALKVDFWDVDEMANKIAAVLRYPALQRTLREEGRKEMRKFSWNDSARRVRNIYQQVIGASRSLCG